MLAVVLLDALVENRFEEVEEEHVDGEKGDDPYHNNYNDLKETKRRCQLKYQITALAANSP